MRVTSLKVSNFRSFVGMEQIELGSINVFVGPNNTGKSSLLRAIYLMQESDRKPLLDVRMGSVESTIDIGLADVSDVAGWQSEPAPKAHLKILLDTEIGLPYEVRMFLHVGDHDYDVERIPARDPDHVIVPFFSRRKVTHYQEDVRAEYALQISEQFDYLAAKLSRLANPAFPGSEAYRKACEAVLGFVVTAVPSDNGQRPGLYLPDRRLLPLDQMGEGVPQIVGLLADLALSEDKILLIEEPENDLHPSALKALLELIEKSSRSNQVFVSTHSNVVVRHLGAAPDSRLFAVDSVPEALPPIATVRQVDPTPQARMEVLRDLGYRLSDFDLWDGWLILEEASAELIVRDYLIPWFAPRLTRVRTLSAAGAGNVEPTFEDFRRLALFTHLEPAYRDAAWVRIDGDSAGTAIVSRLRERYPSWSSDRFATFSEPAFERYYPEPFRARVEAALAEPDVQGRRAAKAELLAAVRAWIDEDADRARGALVESAAPVIEDLRGIETQLARPQTVAAVGLD